MSETISAQNLAIIESRPRFSQSVMMTPMLFSKNALQGASAGLLTLAGATQFAGPSQFLDSGFGAAWTVEALGAQLIAGDMTGILQILGAGALFLTAGHGFARVLGLLVFVLAASAYLNGVEPADILERSRAIYRALGPAYAAFQDALMMS